MKTAMQELRETVQSMLQNGGDDDLWAVISHIDDKLEKEKEQIKTAWLYGQEDGAETCTPNQENPDEKYYNETYQNK